MLARVEAPALAAQPLAVQQVGAGQIRAELGPAEPVNRLLIETFGRFALAEQRPAARLDAEGEIVAAGLRRLVKPPERGGRHVGVPGAGGGLDQLGHHQDGDEHLGVPGGLFGRRQRVGVASEAVVQDRGRPVRPCRRAALSPRLRPRQGGLDQRGHLRLVAAQRTEEHGGDERDAARPGRLADRIALRDQGNGRREVTPPRIVDGERDQVDRQLVERADAPGQLDLPEQDRALAILVPERDGGPLGHRAELEPVVGGDVSLAKALTACRSAGAAAAGPSVTSRAKPSSSRSRGRCGLFRRGEGLGGAGDLQHVAGARQAPGERRRHPRGQVGVAGQVPVERLEPLGRLQQQRRSVAAPARGERDVAAQQVHPGAGELVERPGLRHGEQVQGLAERAGLHAGLRRGQRAFGPPGRIGGQRHRRSRNAAAAASPPRACARPADRSSSAATSSSGPGRGLGPVPGPPVRIGDRVGHLRQRRVHLLPVGERRRPVGRRAHQRMPEPHPRRELDQPGLHRRRRRLDPDAQPPGRPPDQRRGRRTDRPPPAAAAAGSASGRASSWRVKLSSIRPVSGAAAGGRPNPPASSRRGQPARQLQQRQRVTAGLGHDQVADPLVQRPGQRRVQQRPRVVVPQPVRRPARAARPARRPARGPRTPAPTGSAASRRAANPSACAEARSSHCSSSIRQISGRSPATSDSRLSTASPTRNRSGGGPGGQAERGPQRVALRHRQPLERGPASARTADAARRTPAPSPTARPPRALPGSPARARPAR